MRLPAKPNNAANCSLAGPVRGCSGIFAAPPISETSPALSWAAPETPASAASSFAGAWGGSSGSVILGFSSGGVTLARRCGFLARALKLSDDKNRNAMGTADATKASTNSPNSTLLRVWPWMLIFMI